MWKKYRKSGLTEMRPYIPGESLDGVSVSEADVPQHGGMVARNSENHTDQWYVDELYFINNYEVIDDD